MEPGIFTKVFPRTSFGAVFDAIAAAGLRQTQLIMCADGDETLLPDISEGFIADIRSHTARTGVQTPVLSGIFNMAHPDPVFRAKGLSRLIHVIRTAPAFGATAITLCTGTRDPDNMWRWHPDNDSDAAWHDLLDGLQTALAVAEAHGVTLAFEPEPGNLVNRIDRARQLLDQLPSPALGVALDGANIVMCEAETPPAEVLERVFATFGDRIAVLHAKDCDPGGHHVPAGKGIVPWDQIVRLLRGVDFRGPLILHSLDEQEVPDAVATLRTALNADA